MVLASLALVLAPDAIADEESAAAGGTRPPLEEIVVEATRAELTVLDIAVNTSILSQQDIQDQVTASMDQVLRQIPGFNLLRGGDTVAAAPSTRTVSLRGLGGTAASRTLVLLDGIPIHSPISSEVYWARIPKHQVERVEVVRGGGANSWGNLSLGGVINIVTEAPRENGVAFSGILSDPTTVDLSLAASQVGTSWEGQAEASYYDMDGYFNVRPEDREPIDQALSMEYGTASGKLAWRLGERARLSVRGSVFNEKRNAGLPKDNDETGIWTVGSSLTVDGADGSRWRADLFYEDLDQEDFSARIINDGQDDTLSGLRDQVASVLGAGLSWSQRFGKHALNAGIDYRWTEFDLDNYSSYSNESPRRLMALESSQDLGGVFIQDTWDVSNRWQVSASLRYDRVTNSGNSVNSNLVTGGITGTEQYPRNTESTVNPYLGLLYRLNDRMSFRAAAYKGFRAPSLRELYRSATSRGGVVLVNNPALAPEHLVGVEGGADFQFSERGLLRLTVFRNTIEDQIQNITLGIAGDTPTVVQPCGLLNPGETCQVLDNVGETEATGLEVETQYDPTANWSLFLSYLYNDSKITKAPGNPEIEGNPIRQAPRNNFTARVRNNNRWFDTSLSARYVGKRYEDELATLEVDDSIVFDLRFSHRFSAATELFLNIENLFDEDYEVRTSNNGFTEIGRPRFISIGLNYRR
jgi:outer membrane receptor protein involved in Fe transport